MDLGSSTKQFKDLHINGTAYLDAIGFGTVSLTLPTSDGSANQVLSTNGSGTLSWTSLVSSLNDLSDVSVSTNQITFGDGNTTAILPTDDNEVDLGSSTKQFKDLHINGTAYLDAIGFGTVSLTLPTSDGSANQVLSTNGSGTLSWTSLVSSLDDLSDVKKAQNSIFTGTIPSNLGSGASANISYGINSLDSITSGDDNSAIGYQSLTDLTSGLRNSAFGKDTLKSLTTAVDNSAFGATSLQNVTTGNDNTCIGSQAGNILTTGAANTIIGKSANASSSSSSNQIVIGINATGQADNSVTLGNADVTAVYMAQDSGATVYCGGLNIGGTSLSSTATELNLLDGVTSLVSSLNDLSDVSVSTNQITFGDGNTTAILPTDDNEVDLGSSAKQFKDLHINGTAYLDALGLGTDSLTLPTSDGSSNQVLSTNGSGALSWTDMSISIIGSTNGTNAHSTNSNISSITFSKDSGFIVNADNSGAATVTLGSHWKTITAVSDGGSIGTTSSITPTGQEDIKFVAGNNITIELDSTSGDQKLKISGTSSVTSLNDLTDVSVLSNQITFGDANTTAILPADDNGVSLGSSSYSFADAHIQGIIYASQINNGITLTLPTADGSTNQVLKTNGSGVLSWTDMSSGGASSLNDLTDVSVSSNEITFGDTNTTAILPADDNGVSLGSSSYSFADAYFEGIIYASKINNGVTLTLPTSDGTANQLIETDGSGNLSWTSISLNDLTDVKIVSNKNSIYLGSTGANVNSNQNTSVGFGTLTNLGSTGGGNVAVGTDALTTIASASRNTGIGNQSLKNLQSSNDNTGIGHNSGLVLTTGTRNTLLGANTEVSENNASNQIVIGADVTGLGNNYAVIGDEYITRLYVASDGAGVLYANGTIQTSDRRQKKDIVECNLGLEFINKLSPVSYKWKDEERRGVKNHYGLIAQDVDSTLEKLGISINDNNIVHYEDNKDEYKMNYNELIGPLIKSVQELNNDKVELSNKVNELENENKILKEQLNSILSRLDNAGI